MSYPNHLSPSFQSRRPSAVCSCKRFFAQSWLRSWLKAQANLRFRSAPLFFLGRHGTSRRARERQIESEQREREMEKKRESKKSSVEVLQPPRNIYALWERVPTQACFFSSNCCQRNPWFVRCLGSFPKVGTEPKLPLPL